MEAIDETVLVNRYPAYKDSGTDWLGEIPTHWEVRRIKYACAINQNSLAETTSKGFKFQYVDISSVTLEAGVFQTEEFAFKDAPSRARRIAKAGDTVISTVRTYLKAIDFIDEKKSNYVYSTGFAVLNPSQSVLPEFLAMAVRSDSFTEQVSAHSKGMSYPAINSTDLSCLCIPLPPLAEQTRIADFLDRKTAQIDQAIAQKERLIELLNERRQVLIHRAVTRGLNPDAPMKDSGIEWIGEIPAHWEVKKLKYVLGERNSKSETGSETLFMVSQEHGLVVRADYHEKAIAGQSSVGSKRVFYNDLVFNKLKAHLGVFFKSTIREVGLVSPDYAVYYSNGVIEDLKFLEILFRHPAYIRQFICNATGIVEGLIRLYTGDLFNIRIPVPPKQEQREILRKANEIASKVDDATKKAQRQIQKLQELKSTLINAAVTGKIRV